MSCAEHAVHQTKNDEPRWGPDGGQKHAKRPKAQALRAPRLNDSPSLSHPHSMNTACVCAYATYALRGFAECIHEYRVHRDTMTETPRLFELKMLKREIDNRIYIYIYNRSYKKYLHQYFFTRCCN